jgi:hypothetical protein
VWIELMFDLKKLKIEKVTYNFKKLLNPLKLCVIELHYVGLDELVKAF